MTVHVKWYSPALKTGHDLANVQGELNELLPDGVNAKLVLGG